MRAWHKTVKTKAAPWRCIHNPKLTPVGLHKLPGNGKLLVYDYFALSVKISACKVVVRFVWSSVITGMKC